MITFENKSGFNRLLRYKRIFFVPIVLFLLSSKAYAVRDVSSARVDDGKFRVEIRNGFEFDDLEERNKRFRHIYIFEYGVTSWWSTRINFRFNRPDSEAYDLVASEWLNKFWIFNEKEHGFEGGVRLAYTHADNAGLPDIFEFRGILEENFDLFRLRGNLNFLWQIGSDARRDVSLGASLELIIPYNERLSYGIEWYGDFGEISNMPELALQEHQLGPVINYRLDDNWSVEVGYLFGLTQRTTEGTPKLFIRGIF